MNLVIFTAHYPFGTGESFFEDEIRIAEQYFNKITFVTYERNAREASQYVPSNARVIRVRENANKIDRLLKGAAGLFKLRFWKELFYAKRTTPYSTSKIFKQLLIEESVLNYLQAYKKEWAEQDKDTVYYSYWLGAEFAFENADLPGLKISRAHGGDCFFLRGYHPYRREELKNIGYIFPISETGRDDIVFHYKADVPQLAAKVKTAHMGIQISGKSNPMPIGSDHTIVTCSNIIPLKRLDLLIDALSQISDLKIRWLHFGEGYLKEEILRQAKKKLGTKENISYEFKGYVNNHELMQLYETTPIDLFVNCSDVEGIPVSVMEAMEHGIPAIGRNVGGVNELIDAECGVLLPEKADSTALAEAIRKVFCLSAEDYSSMRENAKEKIKRNFDAQKNYHNMYQFLTGCIHNNGRKN